MRRVRRSAPGEAADDPAASADAHCRVQLRGVEREHGAVCQGDRHAVDADRQARGLAPAARLRPRREVGIRHQHRLGRPHRRGGQRQADRRLFPRPHLRAARHERIPGLRPPRNSGRGRRTCICASADGSLAPQPLDARSSRNSDAGGGGLYSTARDYMAFLRMLLQGGSLDGGRISCGPRPSR